jgi:hypothetical protein
LGANGKTFAYFGLNDALRECAKKAGIEGFHPRGGQWLDRDYP